MDIKKIDDFILNYYENKNTKYKAKSYIKKGISIFESAGILDPTEDDFFMISDNQCRSYTHAFYSWLNSEKKTEEKIEKQVSIKKRNINFLIDDDKYKILSVLAVQFDTTITAILTAAIDDYFLSHVEQIEKIKKFLDDE